MKNYPRGLAAGLSAALVVGAGIMGIGQASAAGDVPPWQDKTATNPLLIDTNNVGTLTFYDSTGAAITAGSTQATLGKYVGSVGLAPLAGNAKAVLYAYTPNPALAPGAWSGSALSGATTWPNASAPAPLNTNTHPLVTETAGDNTLDDYATNVFPNGSSTTGYQHVYELRVFDTGVSGVDAKYASADVLVDAAAHTWTQVFPGSKSATSVSITSTAKAVTAGKAFTVNGTLTGASVSGQTIALTITPVGHPAKVVNVTTDAGGLFHAAIKATYTTKVVADFAGNATEAESTSNAVTTTANSVVKITSPKTGVKTKTRKVKVTGTTTPKSGKVTLYEKKGSKFAKLGSATLSKGKFTFSHTFAKGTHVLQVRIAKTATNGAGTSALVTVKEI